MTARRRPVLLAWAAALALLGLVLGAAWQVQPSQAAWQDDAVSVANASAGTWGGGGGEGPFTPGNDDTVISGATWAVASATQYCVDVEVTTESTDPVAWAMDVDTSGNPFNSSLPDELQGAVPSGTPVAGEVVEVTGTDGGPDSPFNATWNNHLITAGQTATVRVCDYDAGLPAVVDAGDDTYSYASEFTGTTLTNSCVSTRIDGASSPFYVGWEVVVDWSDVLDAAVADGTMTAEQADVLRPMDLTRWDAAGDVEVSQAGDVYTVRGMTSDNAAITDGETITVLGCVS